MNQIKRAFLVGKIPMISREEDNNCRTVLCYSEVVIFGKAVIFDFDDTLVHTNPLFDEAKSKFYTMMKDLELDDHEVLDIVNHYDIQNVISAGGFAKECFPKALVQTYAHYCRKYGKKECRIKAQEFEQVGWDVLSQKPELFSGVTEVLSKLQPLFDLFLVTKGDLELQRVKVAESGLLTFFQKVYVVHDKTVRLYKEIIENHQISPAVSWSVGNSIKSDINPAILAGLNGIHIQSSSWDFEHAEPVGDIYTIKHLSQILDIVINTGIKG